MNPAEVLKKALNEHFNDTRFNARLVPHEKYYVFEVKYADRRYFRSATLTKELSRREVVDIMFDFIVDDFSTTYKGKRLIHEAHRSSSR